MKKITKLTPLLALAAAAPALAADATAGWRAEVTRMIVKNQSYPRSAQIRGLEGTTRLSISIAKDGRISDVRLTSSSGSSILDMEAQSIIGRIGKFPAPPAGIQSIAIPIVWRLD